MRYYTKDQLISKANCQAVNTYKKQKNELVFTNMRRVFIRFLEEIKDAKKTFQNYLTFKNDQGTGVFFLKRHKYSESP
jgi:hypothetical protein